MCNGKCFAVGRLSREESGENADRGAGGGAKMGGEWGAELTGRNESDCHRQRQRQQCQSLAAAQMFKGEKAGRKGEGRGLARAAQGSWCRANGNGSALSKVVAVVGLCFVIARGNGTSKAI